MGMSDRITAPKLRALKEQGQKIVCVTAYDQPSGALADNAGVDLILVGDSLGTVLLGYSTTVPVTLEQVEHHVRATRAGVQRALLVADMPFGSYGSTIGQAVDSAVRLMKAGADAVKLEGPYYDEVAALVKAGIPTMGHLGMTPQSYNVFGGHKVQGKSEEASETLALQARHLQESGAFSIVLELTVASVAEEVSKQLLIPTIGIGAGAGCDGQVQVWHDLMGLAPKVYKHAKRYVNAGDLFADALTTYANEVRQGTFPTKDNSF